MTDIDLNEELAFLDRLDEEMGDVEAPPAEPQPQPDQPKKKKKKGSSIPYYAAMALFVGVFIGCAIYLVNYMDGAIQATQDYDKLSDMVNGMRGDHDDPDSTVPTGGSISGGGEAGTADTDRILEKYRDAYAINNDLIGWINVPGTVIDYPVVQSKRIKDYYLNINFYGKWSDAGCIYAREECDWETPCDNVVLYGHHMKYGGMFAALDGYKRKSFWQEHQYFTFDTIYEEHTYQVIAAFKTSANLDQGFAYHTFNYAESEEEFNKFISTVRSLQMYHTGVTAEYGDMLLTLSTCEYTLDNGRFVVIAKRVS